jgi:hypothetical protein
VEVKAVSICAVAAGVIWLTSDLWAAFVLTVTGAIAIVSFRGLAAQVRGLSPLAGSGARFGLLRLGTLALALFFVSRLGLSRPTALYLGLGILPTALMLEALHQLFEADP